jgi:probable addiction module antidote protein
MQKARNRLCSSCRNASRRSLSDADELLRAIGYVAKARGMAQLARESGIGREGLYKALRAGSHPQFETIIKVLHSLNINLVAVSRREELGM